MIKTTTLDLYYTIKMNSSIPLENGHARIYLLKKYLLHIMLNFYYLHLAKNKNKNVLWMFMSGFSSCYSFSSNNK